MSFAGGPARGRPYVDRRRGTDHDMKKPVMHRRGREREICAHLRAHAMIVRVGTPRRIVLALDGGFADERATLHHRHRDAQRERESGYGRGESPAEGVAPAVHKQVQANHRDRLMSTWPRHMWARGHTSVHGWRRGVPDLSGARADAYIAIRHIGGLNY